MGLAARRRQNSQAGGPRYVAQAPSPASSGGVSPLEPWRDTIFKTRSHAGGYNFLTHPVHEMLRPGPSLQESISFASPESPAFLPFEGDKQWHRHWLGSGSRKMLSLFYFCSTPSESPPAGSRSAARSRRLSTGHQPLPPQQLSSPPGASIQPSEGVRHAGCCASRIRVWG